MVSMDLVFSGTDSSDTVTVVAEVDMAVEDDETFTLTLTTQDMAVTVGELATVTITDGTTESRSRLSHISLCKPYPSFSEVRIGFDQTTLSVEEGADGPSSSLVVSVMTGGATLEREVTVTVMSDDVTASM